MRIWWLALHTVVLCARLAAGREGWPDTPEQAADAVLATLRAQDEAALQALAERDAPDPWFIVDALCQRGEHGAAEAFARTAPRRDTERLPAYVEARAGKPDDTVRRDALQAAHKAADLEDFARARSLLEEATEDDATVTGVQMHVLRGYLAMQTKRYEESRASYERAARACGALGWLRMQGSALHSAGNAATHAKNWRGTLVHRREAAALHRARGNRAREGRALHNAGIALRKLGRIDEAVASYEQALRLREGRSAMTTHDALATIAFARRRLDEAERHLVRMAELAAAAGERGMQVRALANLGVVYRRLRRLDEAAELFDRALELSGTKGWNKKRLELLDGLSGVQAQRGMFEQAVEYRRQAMALRRERGDLRGATKDLAQLGSLFIRAGEIEQALSVLAEALRWFERHGIEKEIARTSSYLGIARTARGEYAAALALQAAETEGNVVLLMAALGNLGHTLVALRRYERAEPCFRRARDLAEEIGNPEHRARCLGSLAWLLEKTGELEQAHALREEAIGFARGAGARRALASNRWGLARVLALQGRHAEAVEELRLAVDEVSLLAGGFAAEVGARARERWIRMFQHGIALAGQLDDPAAAAFFLETGRAGSLLEALGGRETLQGSVVRIELRREERAARAEEAGALRAFRSGASRRWPPTCSTPAPPRWRRSGPRCARTRRSCSTA
jgi:tetratricopeptide (TPR) repeat protein